MSRTENGKVQLPPGTGRRKKGIQKPQIGLRVPDDLRDYIEQGAAREGATMTSVVLSMLYAQKDLAETLGDDWWELERRARVEGSRAGIVAGRIVRDSMQQPPALPDRRKK